MTFSTSGCQPCPGATLPDPSGGPRIGVRDAAELCAEVYPTWNDALQIARRLRAAGWVVVEHARHRSVRADGLVMVASVYHPVTYESPGDLFAPGW